MKIENIYSEYIDLLKGEYKDTFLRIDVYISSSNLVVDDPSDIMDEVLDLLLSAQENNKSIEDVIGNDIEYFCNQLIESRRQTFSKKILSFLVWFRYIILGFGIIEVINLIIDYSDHVSDPLFINVEIGFLSSGIIIGAIIGNIYNYMRKKFVFKYKWFTSNLDNILIAIIIIALIIIELFFSDNFSQFLMIPRYIFIPLSFILYIVLSKKKKKEEKIDISDMAYNENIKRYRKLYEKTKEEDVKEWYEKRYNKEIKYQKICIILLGILIIGIILFQIYIDGLMEGLIFGSILFIIEIPIYKFFKKGDKIRQNIYQDIKNKNTDIYNDSLFKGN